MPLSNEQNTTVRKIADAMDDLQVGIKRAEDVVGIYDSRNYSTEITDVNLAESGWEFNTTDLTAAINCLRNLVSFRDNNPVTQKEWGKTMDKVRRTT